MNEKSTTKLEVLENIKANHKGKVKTITMRWGNPLRKETWEITLTSNINLSK